MSVVMLLAVQSWGMGPVAAAQTGGVVGDGQVVTLPYGTSPPARTRSLASLAGAGFVATAVRSAFARQFDLEGGPVFTGPGDELVFVAAQLETFDPPLGKVDSSYTGTTLSVTFAGHSVMLPLAPSGQVSGVAGSTSGATGTEFAGGWVVSLPEGAAVTLTATEGEFSQAVDLRTGRRVGVVPTALYRNPAGPLGLDLRSNLSGTLAVSTGSDRITFPVTVPEAVLTFFRLDTDQPTTGLPASEAYLLVSVTAADGQGSAGQYYFVPSDPPTAATLTVPGTGVIPASFGPAFDGSDQNIDGIFGFVVPATLSSATLTLGTGTGPAVYFDSPDTTVTPIETTTAVTPATFPLTFTAAQPVPAPAATATAGPPAPVSSPPSTSTAPSRKDQSSPQVKVPASHASDGRSPGVAERGGGESRLAVTAGATGAGGATVVVLGVVVWRRRTQLVEPHPVAFSEPDTLSGLAVLDGTTGASSVPTDAAQAVPAVLPSHESGASRTVASPGVPVGSAVGTGAPVVVPRLVVRVLGRLEVEGTTGVIRRRTVQRALIVLAVSYGRPITSEELRGSLAQHEMSEPTAATVRSELSRLRAVLPDGVLPDRSPGSGYGLAGPVLVDWAEFKNLASQARAAEGDARLDVANRALRLVRGPVLEGGGWHGIDRTVWEIEAAVESFAIEIAGSALDDRRPSIAAAAAAQGLLAVPGSPNLWQLRLQAARTGSGENPAVIAERARSQLGHDLPPPD
jgi:hypothetical protein